MAWLQQQAVLATLTLVDLKTQGVRAATGPSTYRSWGHQLAAYRRALGKPMTCMNLIVNSREPAESAEHR